MIINLSNIKTTKIYFVITILTFIIYWNGINNEYSMDDNIVVENNIIVEEGIKAIPKIFKSRYSDDKKQSYDYRPLVIASFALEKQFFKSLPPSQTKEQKLKKDKLTQANISHFINILLYAITCILIFKILVKLFEKYHVLLPLITTLIFIVHPLHTEVVDNIKSRDELLMFLFMLLSIKYFIKYADESKMKYLIIAPLFALLSFLSKKNGFAIIGILPVIMYYKAYNFKKVLLPIITLILIFGCFVLMKKGLLSGKSFRDLQYFENPLLFSGNLMDRITVGFYCSLFYFEMLIFPIDLSFYYGYNQIPMVTWADWQVWVSTVIFLPTGVYGMIKLYQRKIIGLGIILWLGVSLSVINVFFPIVGIVADRFTYTFSLGFCIVVAYLLMMIFKIDLSHSSQKLKLSSSFIVVVVLIIVIYSGRTIARNPDWHDQMTLYSNDIEHLQESAKAHALWANTYYPMLAKEIKENPNNPQNKVNVEQLIYHYREAIRIDSTYLTSINNLGSTYMNFYSDYNNTIKYCEKAVKMDDNYLEAHFNLAYSYDALGNSKKSLYHYMRVIEINPKYMRAYDAFNKVVIKSKLTQEGIDLLLEVAKKVDQPKNVYLDIANLYTIDNYNINQSLIYFVKAFEYDKTDKVLCNHIATLYNSLGDNKKANYYINLCNL